MKEQDLQAAIAELKSILEDMKALLEWHKLKGFEAKQRLVTNLRFYDTTLNDLNNKYSEFLFEVVDPTFHDRAEKIRDSGKDNIIVAGLSYGQGSSREHAALCPMFMGVKAVIAKSFERIHTANLINFGIVPLIFKNEKDYEKISQGDELELPSIRDVISKGGSLMVKNKTNGAEFEVEYNLSDRQKKIILAGGTLAYMKNQST